MKNYLSLAAAGVLLSGAYYFYKQKSSNTSELGDYFGGAVNGVTQGAAELVDYVTGGSLKLSAMANVSYSDLQNKNVQAFLRVIRSGEGTADEGGYKRLFGGGTFASYAAHPDIAVKKGGYTSTAAGAYQFLTSTWRETASIMGLRDFSPESQDVGAVGRIAARGALDDVKAGRFERAVKKCAYEWASLPTSPYGQPTLTMAAALLTFGANGGIATA